MAFKIEKGVPIAPHGLSSKASRWPFDEMELQESFLLPTDVKEEAFRVAMSRHNRRGEKRFMSRRTKEGLRCWRIM